MKRSLLTWRLLNERVGLNAYICCDMADEIEVQFYSGVVHNISLALVICPPATLWNWEGGVCTASVSEPHPAVDSTGAMAQEDWESECVHLPDASVSPVASVNEAALCETSVADCLETRDDNSDVPPTDDTRRIFNTVPDNKKKLFVANVNFRSSQRAVWKALECFGKVQYCKLLIDHKGRSKGCAVVTFASEHSAEKALNGDPSPVILNNRTLELRRITRRIYESKQDYTTQPEKLTREPADMFSGDVQDMLAPSDGDRVSADEDMSPCHVNTLNDLVLLHIFCMLTLRERIMSERVCRYWREMSLLSWTRIKQLNFTEMLRPMQMLTDDIVRDVVSRCSPNLNSIVLDTTCYAVTDRSIDCIAHRCPNLLRVVLSGGIHVSNTALKTLAQSCRSLQSFTIHDRHFRIGEKGLWWLFHRCKQLKYVDIEGCSLLKGQCLHVISSQVEFLSLASCSKLRDVGLEKISMQLSQTLTHLNISNCSSLTDVGLQSVSKLLKLVSLDVSGTLNEVTDGGLALIGRLPALETLGMKNCQQLTDNVLQQISIGCRQLRCVDVSHTVEFGRLTDAGLCSLADHCPLLTSLSINHLTMLTDATLFALAARVARLVTLSCRCCDLVTDAGLCCILERCCDIELIDITGCCNISNISLTAAAAAATHQLKLSAGGSSVELTDEVKLSLPQNLVLDMFQPYNLFPSFHIDTDSDDSDG